MIDDAVIAEAQRALGTRGLKATVDAALRESIRAHRRRALADSLRAGTAFDFEHEALARAEHWQP